MLDAFEKTYDWLNNINSELLTTNPQLASTLILYQELSNDPLFFECYFKARNQGYY